MGQLLRSFAFVFIIAIAIHSISKLYQTDMQFRLLEWTMADDTPVAEQESNSAWQFRASKKDQYQAVFDEIEKYQGNASVKLASTVNTPEGFSHFSQVIDPAIYRGKRIAISAYLKSQNVAEFSGIWARIDSDKDRAIQFDNMSNRPVLGDTAWRMYTIVLDVPQNASSLSFGMLLKGVGTLWADQFAINIVSDEVQSTDLYAGKRNEADYKESRKELQQYNEIIGRADPIVLANPSNLDFNTELTHIDGAWQIAAPLVGKVNVGLDHTQLYRDKPSLKYHVTDPDLYLGTLYQKIDAGNYTGKVIRLSSIFKTEKITSRAGIWVRIEDANGKVIGFDNMDNQPLSGDQPWRRYAVILDVPEKAQTIAFGGLVIGTGTMWFDSFKLESIGESQATPKQPNLFPENLGLEKLTK